MHLHMICKMADSLNAITDATTAAGANQIGGITFSVSDTKQQEVRDGLVTAAIADASSKADKLASNMGVKVVGVQTASVSEGALYGRYIHHLRPEQQFLHQFSQVRQQFPYPYK